MRRLELGNNEWENNNNNFDQYDHAMSSNNEKKKHLVFAIQAVRKLQSMLQQLDFVQPHIDNIYDSIHKVSYYLQQDATDACYYICYERNRIVNDITANDTLTSISQFKASYQKATYGIQKRIDIQQKINHNQHNHNNIIGGELLNLNLSSPSTTMFPPPPSAKKVMETQERRRMTTMAPTESGGDELLHLNLSSPSTKMFSPPPPSAKKEMETQEMRMMTTMAQTESSGDELLNLNLSSPSRTMFPPSIAATMAPSPLRMRNNPHISSASESASETETETENKTETQEMARMTTMAPGSDNKEGGEFLKLNLSSTLLPSSIAAIASPAATTETLAAAGVTEEMMMTFIAAPSTSPLRKRNRPILLGAETETENMMMTRAPVVDKYDRRNHPTSVLVSSSTETVGGAGTGTGTEEMTVSMAPPAPTPSTKSTPPSPVTRKTAPFAKSPLSSWTHTITALEDVPTVAPNHGASSTPAHNNPFNNLASIVTTTSSASTSSEGTTITDLEENDENEKIEGTNHDEEEEEEEGSIIKEPPEIENINKDSSKKKKRRNRKKKKKKKSTSHDHQDNEAVTVIAEDNDIDANDDNDNDNDNNNKNELWLEYNTDPIQDTTIKDNKKENNSSGDDKDDAIATVTVVETVVDDDEEDATATFSEKIVETVAVDADADGDDLDDDEISTTTTSPPPEGSEKYVSFRLYEKGLQLFYDENYTKSIQLLTKFCELNYKEEEDGNISDTGDTNVDADASKKEEEDGNGNSKDQAKATPSSSVECIREDEENDWYDATPVQENDYLSIAFCTIELCKTRPVELRETAHYVNDFHNPNQSNRGGRFKQVYTQNDMYYHLQELSNRIWFEEDCYCKVLFNYGLLCSTAEERIEVFTLVVEKDPHYFHAIYQRTKAYVNTKQWKLAKVDLEYLVAVFEKVPNKTKQDQQNLTQTQGLLNTCNEELHPHLKKGHLKSNEVDDIMKKFDLENDGNSNDDGNGTSHSTSTIHASNINGNDGDNNDKNKNDKEENNKKKAHKKGKTKKKKK